MHLWKFMRAGKPWQGPSFNQAVPSKPETYLPFTMGTKRTGSTARVSMRPACLRSR